MNAETMARALGGASKGNSGWSCKCPSHNDGTASLSLGEKDGRLLWHCHAGCSQTAVSDALRAKGLLPERPRRKAKAKRRIVATYPYKDATGELVLEVVRHEPKDFRQRRPDPDKPGEWIWSIGGISRPLYRLPELLAADPAADVFLVEGEKDVDRLRSLGLTATTTAQGAKGWPKSDHSPLAGRHVVLLPDNDDSGRAYAAQAGRDLISKVLSLRLLELPGLSPKGDASDWLDAGGTADDLRHMAALAPLYEPPPEPERAETDADDFERWNEDLHRNDRGEVRDIIHNVTVILRKDNHFKGRLRYNLMLEAVEAQQLPWRKGGWEPWNDADDIYLAQWCQQRHCYVKRPTCAAAVQIVARDLQHHPIRERLQASQWDGTARVETWLSTFLGVDDTPYTRAVGAAWLVSAVARVFKPGEKCDHALILEGPQGAGKSTAAATIALEDKWFSDEIADLGTKDAGQDMRGKWLIELGELSALNRGAVERVKAFMSRRIDHYRPSYGHRSQDFPRQCVFIGSTNADSYLGDETGGRRFWPVKVGTIDIAALTRDRDQLWAEALAAYRAGAKWWLDKAAETDAREVQADRRIIDPWEQAVMVWARAQTNGVTVQEALANAISMDLDRVTQNDSNRVARIFKSYGWERKQGRIAGARVWQYHRPPDVPKPNTEAVAAERQATAFRRAGASPVSPVAASQTGDRKASNSAPVTSVTSVTSRFQTHTGYSPLARSEGARIGEMQNFTLRKNTGDTGDTGDTHHAWGDLDHWRQQYRQANDARDGKIAVILDWGRAAGGTVDTTGVQIRLSLPDNLPHCYAAAELKRMARGLNLMPKGMFPVVGNDTPQQRRGVS